jgi:hypothetical protein
MREKLVTCVEAFWLEAFYCSVEFSLVHFRSTTKSEVDRRSDSQPTRQQIYQENLSFTSKNKLLCLHSEVL